MLSGEVEIRVVGVKCLVSNWTRDKLARLRGASLAQQAVRNTLVVRQHDLSSRRLEL